MLNAFLVVLACCWNACPPCISTGLKFIVSYFNILLNDYKYVFSKQSTAISFTSLTFLLSLCNLVSSDYYQLSNNTYPINLTFPLLTIKCSVCIILTFTFAITFWIIYCKTERSCRVKSLSKRYKYTKIFC